MTALEIITFESPQSHRDTEKERLRDGAKERRFSLCLSFSLSLCLCGSVAKSLS